jgi:hypothetical protein
MKMNKYPILLDRKNIDKFKVKSTLITSNFKRYEILNMLFSHIQKKTCYLLWDPKLCHSNLSSQSLIHK